MNHTRPLEFFGDHARILDQTRLPHEALHVELRHLDEVANAITQMQVRGAPLIGAVAACGVAIALRDSAADDDLERILKRLGATRPTAVNLHWALDRMRRELAPLTPSERPDAAARAATAIIEEDAHINARIGAHGLRLLRAIAEAKGGRVRMMTHCNTGWLATLGNGTALSPVYAAHAEGIDIHVWVSETRPRNQGLLTAWELAKSGVPHTVMADNAAGLLMMRGEVDLVVTGADRVAANGDTANKVGTYLKALAARDNHVPFYIAAPMSTFDFSCPDGAHIPIEDRDGAEVRDVAGLNAEGRPATVRIVPADTPVSNPSFDVTPARLITGIISEHGVTAPSELATLKDA